MPGLSILEQQYVEALEQLPGLRRRFVEEYVIDLNVRRAAQVAGYKSQANAIGSQVMADPRVKHAIHIAEQLKVEKSMLKASAVLNELALIVHSDIRDYRIDRKGRLRLRRGALRTAYKAVAAVKIKTRKFKNRAGNEVVETQQEIRLWDKNAAIEKAMRHLGLLRNDVHLHDSALERYLRERAMGLHAPTAIVRPTPDGGGQAPPPAVIQRLRDLQKAMG